MQYYFFFNDDVQCPLNNNLYELFGIPFTALSHIQHKCMCMPTGKFMFRSYDFTLFVYCSKFNCNVIDVRKHVEAARKHDLSKVSSTFINLNNNNFFFRRFKTRQSYAAFY